MKLVTLSIDARVNLFSPSKKRFFIRGPAKPIQAKVVGQWIGVDGTSSGGSELLPVEALRTLIVIPARATSCRLRLQYTRALLTETGAMWLARRLPTWGPQVIRNWVRRSPYRPSGGWRGVSIEVPVTPEPPKPLQGTNGAHNKRKIKVGWSVTRLWSLWGGFVASSVLISALFAAALWRTSSPNQTLHSTAASSSG
jgi:hypothetical protein